MTTNDIDAIRKQHADWRTGVTCCPTNGNPCAMCHQRADDVAKDVPALCDEIEQLRASVKQLIDFRNVKVWEAGELAQRLRAVREALGEPHPAETRPEFEQVTQAELAAERARTQETHQ